MYAEADTQDVPEHTAYTDVRFSGPQTVSVSNPVASCENRTQTEINTGLQLTAVSSTDPKTPELHAQASV